MEFQLSYFKSLKCCTQYASKFGKPSSGHRTGKGQFSFQYQRRSNGKECSKCHTIVFISHANKVLLQILLAAAKSIQSCLTLCDPIDGSPPGSAIPGILQARTLEWVAISFSNAWKWKVKVKSLSHVQFLVTPWTAAYQAPPFMGVSRQEYWSGLPLPSPLSAMWSWQMTYSFFFCLNFFFHKMIIIKMLTNQWLGGTKQLKHVKFLKQCLGIQ